LAHVAFEGLNIEQYPVVSTKQLFFTKGHATELNVLQLVSLDVISSDVVVVLESVSTKTHVLELHLHPFLVVFNKQAYLFKFSHISTLLEDRSTHLNLRISYCMLLPSQLKHAFELTILLVKAEHDEPVASLHLFV
jgi:hypothetical protein